MPVTVIALVVAAVIAVAVVGIGLRFLLSPSPATRDFGVAPGTVAALTDIKGIRDITSGVVLAVALLLGSHLVAGAVLLAASLTPIGDAVVVVRRGGAVRTALLVHGLTAAVAVAAGIVLLVR